MVRGQISSPPCDEGLPQGAIARKQVVRHLQWCSAQAFRDSLNTVGPSRLIVRRPPIDQVPRAQHVEKFLVGRTSFHGRRLGQDPLPSPWDAQCCDEVAVLSPALLLQRREGGRQQEGMQSGDEAPQKALGAYEGLGNGVATSSFDLLQEAQLQIHHGQRSRVVREAEHPSHRHLLAVLLGDVLHPLQFEVLVLLAFREVHVGVRYVVV
mmetsp:Transcript_44325/g.141959  ORF Transcript_44325/g.141959 Transcript_44325/m.141959 type:complete len:209 (+) Transcript_44325:846-1472(+)